MIVDIIEYAKLRLLGPSFDETGDEMRSQDKGNKYMVGKKKDKKEGTKLVFSIKLNVNHISCSHSHLPLVIILNAIMFQYYTK